MTRQEQIKAYANSFTGKGMENEELKEIIRLAIIDGATWADEHPYLTVDDIVLLDSLLIEEWHKPTSNLKYECVLKEFNKRKLMNN